LRKTLLRAVTQYSVGMTLGLVTSIARVGVTARVLSEEQNGIWLGLQLLLGYAGNVHLGSLYGMFRSVPMLRARGEHGEAEREKETAFSFVALMAIVGALGLALVQPLFVRGVDRTHLALTIALLAANLLRMYCVSLFRAESRFAELSVSSAVGAGVGLGGVGLVLSYGLTGLLTGMLGHALAESAFLLWRSELPRLRIDRVILRAQLRVGLMTLLTAVGALALTNADRTIMLRVFGPQTTGLYYLGANIVVLIPAIAGVPAAVLTPRFFERVGRGEDLRPLVERPLRAIAFPQAALCAAGAVVLPALVHHIWPAHVPGIPAAMAALLGTYAIVLAGLVTNVYYALDRQGVHVIILAVCAALACASAWLGAKLGGTIVAAAAGAVAVLFLYASVATVLALALLPSAEKDRWRGVRVALAGLIPAAWGCALVALTHVLVGSAWLAGSISGGLAGLGIVTGGFLPLVPRFLAELRGARPRAG
jgi:O-antigen/teichoic acid export membrane protein